jgi:hypothetical protein
MRQMAMQECTYCNGSGIMPVEGRPLQCRVCRGTGRVNDGYDNRSTSNSVGGTAATTGAGGCFIVAIIIFFAIAINNQSNTRQDTEVTEVGVSRVSQPSGESHNNTRSQSPKNASEVLSPPTPGIRVKPKESEAFAQLFKIGLVNMVLDGRWVTFVNGKKCVLDIKPNSSHAKPLTFTLSQTDKVVAMGSFSYFFDMNSTDADVGWVDVTYQSKMTNGEFSQEYESAGIFSFKSGRKALYFAFGNEFTPKNMWTFEKME